MLRQKSLQSKIFLDSGDPEETKEALKLLGFLDGQTTNPSLLRKTAGGKKFSRDEVESFYRKNVEAISSLIPNGSVSVEVHADASTAVDVMLAQGREMFSWVPNAHIKFPITPAGLTACEKAVREGMRVNMTLCFSQEQAAAVYAATRGARRGNVFVSPFVGRLDDRGKNGIDLVIHILRMYASSDRHVEVLTASVRGLDHLFYALYLKSDIITAPLKVLKKWAEKDCQMPNMTFAYDVAKRASIPYEKVRLRRPWQEYDIAHELTDEGLKRFADDWNAITQ